MKIVFSRLKRQILQLESSGKLDSCELKNIQSTAASVKDTLTGGPVEPLRTINN